MGAEFRLPKRPKTDRFSYLLGYLLSIQNNHKSLFP